MFGKLPVILLFEEIRINSIKGVKANSWFPIPAFLKSELENLISLKIGVFWNKVLGKVSSVVPLSPGVPPSNLTFSILIICNSGFVKLVGKFPCNPPFGRLLFDCGWALLLLI